MDDVQLTDASGYDHNFIPDGKGFRKIAEACGDISGISMEVWSDMPGVQFYAGNCIKEQTGENNATYGPRCAFALETQYYPNAMFKTHFRLLSLQLMIFMNLRHNTDLKSEFCNFQSQRLIYTKAQGVRGFSRPHTPCFL